MEILNDKITYLRGLTDGLLFEEESKEAVVLSEIVHVLEDVSEVMYDMIEQQLDLEEYVEFIDEDLSDIEEDIYEVDFDEFMELEECEDIDCDCVEHE